MTGRLAFRAIESAHRCSIATLKPCIGPNQEQHAESGTKVPPNLKQFEEEIQRYKSMEKAMKSLPVSKCIGWTRIDAKPLKKSLEVLVSKWSYLYIKYLQDKVVNEMDDLYSFMGSANEVLDLQVGDEKPVGDEDEEREQEEEELPEGVDPAELRKEKEAQVRVFIL